MSAYKAPVREQQFALETSGDLGLLMSLPRFAGLTPDLVAPVLISAADFSEAVLAPLNRIGDVEGARHHEQGVALPPGFAEAYRLYAEGGWTGLAATPDWGGQGLPFVLGCAVQEQVTSANMAFALCTLLAHGAIEALSAHGSEDQKACYLTKLISGEWTGTMNLTEPQAGSDVGALRTMAEAQTDGSYRIKGTKIFITWGEHDATANIVHLVLARLPDAPAGSKGLSLFVVPKLLEDGRANDVRCLSIERKLGLHGSPTCVMSFGDGDACVGWLVGEANAGMRAMFTMMNNARINVGLQGVAIAERAWQGALAYAGERMQFGPIIEHPDVQRMLQSMKARTEAARALVYFTAAATDRAHGEGDAETRAAAQGIADLLTPVAKAWATEIGVAVASDAVQVFGGMGFIEETGAAQHLRDARIISIYEGTNGIQAIDLVNRKLRLDDGRHWRALLALIREEANILAGAARMAHLAPRLAEAADMLDLATHGMAGRSGKAALWAATPYLQLFGLVTAAFLLGRQAGEAARRLDDADSDAFLEAKLQTVDAFFDAVLPAAVALARVIEAAPPTIDDSHAYFESGWAS